MNKNLFTCSISILLVLAALLCGCQATPAATVVASKNDGTLEAALEKTPEEEPAEATANAEEAADTDIAEAAGTKAEIYTYTESFSSMDGNITYNVNVELPAVETDLPVLQVTPHTITSAEAETIARAIFGDAEFYEYSTEKGKSEIEEEILKLKQHISDRDVLVAYYGGNEETADEVIADFESRISALEALYETASETVEPTECNWQFHSESYYTDPELGLSNDDYNQELKAMVWIDGTPYVYVVYNRNAEDYRIHSIIAYIDDSLIPLSDKYRSDEITDTDITALLDTTNTVLEQMGMGDWEVEDYTVGEWEVEVGHTVRTLSIQVSPVYNGLKMLNVPQLANLKSEDAYASNYYYEKIGLNFSGGRLVDFGYDAPLDVVNVINPAVSILSEDEIIASFKRQMTLDDITGYQIEGIPEELLDEVPQVTNVTATVDGVELGLARTRIKNNESDFYLLPAYLFRGSVNLTFSDGSSELINDTIFAVINAVDGTIINTDLGY